jgi:hypothetical protein
LPEGTASPIRTKNIALETNKRKELNDKLLALREAVPKISKVTQNFIYLFIYLFILLQVVSNLISFHGRKT